MTEQAAPPSSAPSSSASAADKDTPAAPETGEQAPATRGAADGTPAAARKTQHKGAAKHTARKGTSRQGAGHGAEGKKDGSPGRTAAKGGRSVVAWLALLLALSAGGAGYLVWEDLSGQAGTLWSRFEELRGQVGAVESRVGTLQQDMGGTAEQAAQSAAERVAKQTGSELQALRDEVAALNGRVTELRGDDWVLDEVEYLLVIANRRVRLERDVATALTALQLADARLRDLGAPDLVAVRREIARERSALQAVAQPDVTGMALTLASLQEQVDALAPQTFRGPPAAADAADAPADGAAEEDDGRSIWRRLFDDVKRVLSSLVTIRRSDRNSIELLPPNERAFLLQNLKLKLEGARLALLQRDDGLYQDSLKQAAQWLQRYFDDSAQAVAALQQELARLQQVQLRPALPEIGASLQALRSRGERPAAAEQGT